MVALQGKMNKNLKIALERHLVDHFDDIYGIWYTLKIENVLLMPNLYLSWPTKGHQRSTLGQIVELGLNQAD